MYYLAELFPSLRKIKLPLSRDQLMLLLAAINEIFLGLDIYLAHNLSGTIVPYEWIPILFGPLAGLTLLAAGLIAIKRRPLATLIANIVLIASIVIGLLGSYFHIRRGLLPAGPAGARVTVDLLVWAPPIAGPLIFSLVGLLGLSAAWVESPPGSGQLIFSPRFSLQLPYSKTRAYFFMVSMGILATLLSSVLDHARTPFDNPWLWIPTLVGVFGVVVAAGMGMIHTPQRGDLWVFFGTMVVLMVTGVVGLLLHIRANLTAEGLIVQERFLRGAPFLAPLLFANMGLLGLLTLLDPASEQTD